MKRIYKAVGVEAKGAGFVVTLDGRPLRSPGKHAMALPTRRLAEAVAAEWDAQGETVAPRSMAMMGFAATVTDRVTPQRRHVVDEIAGFGGSDLLCFLADGPEELVSRQRAQWAPWLAWAEKRFGAALAVTSGIMPVRQEDRAIAALHAAVESVDDWHLAPLHTATTVTGSLVLALAVHAGELDAEEAFELSQIDETFQTEQWGQDREAEQRRRGLREEMKAAAAFVALLDAEPDGAGRT